jgi:hypothetical protein
MPCCFEFLSQLDFVLLLKLLVPMLLELLDPLLLLLELLVLELLVDMQVLKRSFSLADTSS